MKLWRYPIPSDKFQLVDKIGNETCICKFVKDYEKNRDLSGCFAIGRNSDYSKPVFGELELIQQTTIDEHEKLSSDGNLLQNDNLKGPEWNFSVKEGA